VIYREMNYQNMKRNPQISHERVVKSMRKFSIRVQVAKSFFIMTFLGSFLCWVAFISSGLGLSLIFTLSLVFSLIYPAQNIAISASSRVFEPLRYLPVRFSERMLAVFFIDSINILAFATPTIAVLMVKSPYFGLYSLLWVIAAILLGYAIVFLYYALFGVKVRSGFSKSVLGGILFFAVLVFALRRFQEIPDLTPYLTPHLLLLSYAASSATIKLSTGRVWRSILNPEIVEVKGSSRLSSGSPLWAMLIKDFRLILRKNALFPLIVPLVIVMPNVVSIANMPNLSIFIITTISTLSTIDLRIIGNLENVDFLRMLPLSKRGFVMSKACLIFVISFAASLPAGSIAFIVSQNSFYLFMAFAIPAIVSMLSSLIIFWQKGEEIYFPEVGFLKWMGLLLVNFGAVYAVLSPRFILSQPLADILSSVLSLLAMTALFEKLRRI